MSNSNRVKYTEISQNDTNENEEKTKTLVSTLSRKQLSGKNVKVSSAEVWTQRNLNSLLIGAIYANDDKKIEELLQQGANPNSTCRTYKFTAVHVAVWMAKENILNLLIQKGAKVIGIDRNGLSPLHYAAWYNRARCIDILLQYIPLSMKYDYLNLKSNLTCPIVQEFIKDSLDHDCSSHENELPTGIPLGSTALHIACQNIHHKCVEVLLKHQPDLKITDDRKLNAFEVIGENLKECEFATETNFINIIKLLQNNITQETVEKSCRYFTPLHCAVMLSSAQGISILMRESKISHTIFDQYGQTAIHLAIIKQLELSLVALLESVKDVSVIKNEIGITVFQTAVERQWIKGVGLLLNAKAKVTEVAADGRTVLHVAACSGNVEFLEELLELEEIEKILNVQNNVGETPIFSAVTSGNPQCVLALLDEGADINIKLNGNINILHRAAEYGNEEILIELLKIDDEQKLNLINELDNLPYSGMSPLHMASINNKVECVLELLNWQCDFQKKTTNSIHKGASAIHLAAARGNDEVVKALLDHDKCLLWILDDENKEPLHYAALNGQRNCIEVLLNAGADLSSLYDGESALDIIYRNISRPTDFLETIFDKAIKVDRTDILITDQNCMININFNMLMPKDTSFSQMNILSNILLNGRGLEQRKLLLHPLIESFLHLKWKKMSRIFWMLLVLYALFVIVLTFFVVSLFYYKDDNRPYLLQNIEYIRFIMIILLLFVAIPEILLASQKLKQYTINIDRIIKWISIILVGLLMWSHKSNYQEVWLRHVATFSILTSWIELMFILSKVPTWGYYVQMFFKVSSNVIKVMTVFSFLVVGFALAFMIEFQTTEPFTDPLSGFIKTIVMLTAELDYSGLFTGENKDNAKAINLTIYVVFLMLGTIVLMNLLVGLAVSDIKDLEIIGKIDRHAEQIDFLSILESDTFARFLPQKLKTKLIRGKCIPCLLKMQPSSPKCNIMKYLPQKLKEHLLDIAEDNFNKESEVTNKHLSEKIDDLMKKIEELNAKIAKN